VITRATSLPAGKSSLPNGPGWEHIRLPGCAWGRPSTRTRGSFHFFNPVAVLPLVEVVRGAPTDEATLATALEVGKKLKKSCVLVKDAPAFVVNRLLTRFLDRSGIAEKVTGSRFRPV